MVTPGPAWGQPPPQGFPPGPPPGPPAADQVKTPAILMIVFAAISGLCFLFVGVLSLIGSAAPGSGAMKTQIATGVAGLLIYLVRAAVDGFVIFGAIKMMKLESRGLAMTAAILSVIPCFCSSCYVLGIPWGIWALVVLNKPEVKAAFH